MANPPPRKRTWRDAAAPSPPSLPSPPIEAAWRTRQTAARQGLPWWKSRGARLGFVTAALLLVAAGIVAVVLWWRPLKKFHLVAISAAYENNLFVPPNIWGRNSVDEFIRLAETEWTQGSAPPKEVRLDNHPSAIEEALVEKASKKIVVFVSAHGVARLKDGDLVPYLVPQEDDLRTEETLYPLDRLLEALAKLPKDTAKLLLLDVTGVGAHWPLGQLHNNFARALAGRAQRINGIPNLVVLSSSDVDQLSWASPEWGQTYFAHFVLEGLKGAADGAATGHRNGRVDALELFHYVRAEVQRWVWHNRARWQTPVLFGDDQRAQSLELVACGDYRAELPDLRSQALPGNEGVNDYKELQRSWEKCEELRQASPHPAAYAPHLWRRYLDVLLRAEQLWRNGDTATAKKLLSDLPDLHRRIVLARSVELKSAQLTLAMPETLGLQPRPREHQELTKIVDLWKLDTSRSQAALGNEEAKDKPLAALKKFIGNDPQRRAALTDFVFRKVAEDPERRLVPGRQLLAESVVDPAAPDCRSVEVHYLMMLAENRSILCPDWPLVQTSLQLLRLSEQAAWGLDAEPANERLPAYSEQVLPWIQKLVDSADEPRRLGQDLLFASSPAEWDKAKKLFDEARPGYVTAQELAVKIRRALEVRDQLYAELPYYTHWIAERGSGLDEEAIKLWNEVHELRGLLEKPAAGEEGRARVAQLDELRKRISERFRKIRDTIEESVLNKESPSNQNRWHEIEAALAMPFLGPEARKNLIQASREISRDLFLHPPKESGAEPPINQGDPKRTQEAALRQGRLALAMLDADDWPEEHARVKNVLDHPEEGAWHRSVTWAGQSIGRFFNRLPEEADKLCEKAAAQEVKEADKLLRSAVRYARTIVGAAALTRMTQNPLDEQRRLNLHHLLCWQAHRTFLDWWAELEQTPQKRPYFQRAGAIFLEDAEQLVMSKSVQTNHAMRSPQLKQEKENLQKPVQMIVERSEHRSEKDFRPGRAQFYLTDEDDVEWLYRLRGPKIPGHPVVWVQADGGLHVAVEDAQRHLEAFDKPFSVKITEDNAAGRPPTGVTQHAVEGFFRGHRSQVETSVYMPLRPDRIVSLPPVVGPGHVAVQTKKGLYDLYGAENTAIALVLDLSGSMVRDAPLADSRFKRALRAMRSVLKQLPKGVTISLRTFGAKQFISAENKYGIELVWPARPWNPDNLDALIADVEKLEPWGFTPLVRSIAAAKNDLPDDKKARSIVVITDGGDSTFYKDDERRKDDTIKSFLRRQFGDSDIQVSVIGFEAKESELLPEEKDGYREFRPALVAIGGQYYDADNTELLTEYLTRSLLHMYFQVYPDVGRDAVDPLERGENISRSDKDTNWRWVHLKPDTYRLGIPSVRSLRQRIELRSGDALLLDLVRGLGGRPEFRRSIYAESDYIAREHSRTWTDKSQKDWLLAVLQNYQLPESKKLQLLATLEKYPNARLTPDLIQQIHPSWVWFDVSAPEEVKPAPTLRITSLPNYPADAWGIDVSGWPLNRPAATLKAWWIEDSLRSRACAQLSQGQDFEDLRNLRPHSWLNDSQLGIVNLESIQRKRCDIQVEGRLHKDVNCLVVRLSYPAEKGPFFVRLRLFRSHTGDGNEGLSQIGVEDRFYTRAGKYTGIFWNMTEEKIRNIERLELFSVAELKKVSLRVEKLELDHPNDRFQRPAPVESKSKEP